MAKNMILNNQHTIMVVDDHLIFRKGLIDLIEQIKDFTVIAQAQNGLEAVDLYRAYQPDLTLLDLQMPLMEGVDVVKSLRALDKEAKIIILTTFETDEDIENALKAGAKAYLLKDVTEEELTDCMRKVLAGNTYLPVSVAAKHAKRLTQVQLTAREHTILRLVAEKSMPNKLIASELGISEATVKTHLTNLFDKLEVNSRTEAINVAVRRGLVRIGKEAINEI